MITNPRLFVSVLLWFVAPAFIGTACAPAPMPVSASQRDPSNPNAPEGVTPAAAAPSSGVSEAAASSYVCPMHPEVTSTSAGACPKCNMKLVPKK